MMYLNHRTDAAIWRLAMARDDAMASAAIGAGLDRWLEGDPGIGLDGDEYDPSPDRSYLGDPLTQRCKHGPEGWCRYCDTPDVWEDDCA